QYPAARLSVAPMIDWTDRFCRYFHRRFSKHALLYTEMITAPALIHGDAARVLAYDQSEHPVALQIGGSDPEQLAIATRMGVDAGFDEINLNVGCPSDRVQSGCFGAVLMKDPKLVAACVAAIREAAGKTPVTVKSRIGVDDQDPHRVLPEFLSHVIDAGAAQVTIHARKAWLQGLSPKENRDIPPLDYPLVHQMKAAFPDTSLSINGGITSLDDAQSQLQIMDGVMIGRAAYQTPADILGAADRRIFGTQTPDVTAEEAVLAMFDFIEDELARGTRLHQITRHMLGAFAGRPGARGWRRHLSSEATKPDADLTTLRDALAHLEDLDIAA
ncbi:MAG: tRNA dihydrouridine(20/20a) synthase DusA, partial [Pseudomonadota bacterium]